MIKICVRPGWLMLVVCTFRNIDASVQPHEAKPAKSVANLQVPASRMLLLADLDGGMRQAAPLWFSFVLQLCRWYSRYESVWRYHKIYDAYIYIHIYIQNDVCISIYIGRGNPWKPWLQTLELRLACDVLEPRSRMRNLQSRRRQGPSMAQLQGLAGCIRLYCKQFALSYSMSLYVNVMNRRRAEHISKHDTGQEKN